LEDSAAGGGEVLLVFIVFGVAVGWCDGGVLFEGLAVLGGVGGGHGEVGSGFVVSGFVVFVGDGGVWAEVAVGPKRAVAAWG